MDWLPSRIKNYVFVLLMLMWTCESAVAGGNCCERPIWSYPSGDAVPPECVNLECSVASVYLEGTSPSKTEAGDFLRKAKTIGTLSIIRAKKTFDILFLEQVIHKGNGPAIYLENAKLTDTSFTNLHNIVIDDVSPFCKNRDLIVINGTLDQTVRDHLVALQDKMLKNCATLTTTATGNSVLTSTPSVNATKQKPSSVSPQTCAAQAVCPKAEAKACPSNYTLIITGIVILAILVLALVVVLIFASRMASAKKNHDLILAAMGSYATQVLNSFVLLESKKRYTNSSVSHQPCFFFLMEWISVEAISMDADPNEVIPLAREVKAWEIICSTRTAKFEKKISFWTPLPTFSIPENRSKPLKAVPICAPRGLTVEYAEALEKFEEVKKTHNTGKEFVPPKDTNLLSDASRNNPAMSKEIEVYPYLCTVKPYKTVEKDPKTKKTSRPEESKERKKAGGDKNQNTAATKEKKPEGAKKVEPSKVEQKTVPQQDSTATQTATPTTQKTATAPQQAATAPQQAAPTTQKAAPPTRALPFVLVVPPPEIQVETVERAKCKPLALSKPAPDVLPEIKFDSKILSMENVAIGKLPIKNKFGKVAFVEFAMLKLLNDTSDHSGLNVEKTVMGNAVWDSKIFKKSKHTPLEFPGPDESKKTESIMGCTDDLSLYHNVLMELRAKCDAQDRELL
ncbi:unnamed protein product [Caenorhabditis auriculariae]|uniref:Receptor L-domain domain-containing protein n=1 Tax=Caenorhabditis auriculariae TaxID=2777116 RepID=A0A8S1HMY6_9PELO|nr:unnamed protein product [Caenorhabditis auriculariae]